MINRTKRKVGNVQMTPLRGYPQGPVLQYHFEIVMMFRVERPRSITYLLSLRNAVGDKSTQHSR